MKSKKKKCEYRVLESKIWNQPAYSHLYREYWGLMSKLWLKKPRDPNIYKEFMIAAR